MPGDGEAAFEAGGDAGGAAPAANEAARGSEELADGAAVEVDVGGPGVFFRAAGLRSGREAAFAARSPRSS